MGGGGRRVGVVPEGLVRGGGELKGLKAFLRGSGAMRMDGCCGMSLLFLRFFFLRRRSRNGILSWMEEEVLEEWMA